MTDCCGIGVANLVSVESEYSPQFIWGKAMWVRILLRVGWLLLLVGCSSGSHGNMAEGSGGAANADAGPSVGTDDGRPTGTVTTLYIHGRDTDGLPSGWSYWLNKVRSGMNPTPVNWAGNERNELSSSSKSRQPWWYVR
jgi:hypothetical protein